jgi:hypothetical protein
VVGVWSTSGSGKGEGAQGTDPVAHGLQAAHGAWALRNGTCVRTWVRLRDWLDWRACVLLQTSGAPWYLACSPPALTGCKVGLRLVWTAEVLAT